ncbi:ATP:cob(I)alamin adenosyltransferase [Candidatus Roizmanbacteria bacterium CG_4_9_14_0_8_um_filter_34_12]|uniref:Corrinoid adenosyltransferase n=4 Tax=Candidatus Roizmaniibacteriota TaxID=1752723 RepID=A0A2M7E4Q3_9BACT|nr:MAG: ATP:cob(I)alamin adenosyltransferase [Candidatus Roizmanbacteria bacterium CG22_combo_CG10-13_8_21_14_all_33_16]PIV62693.1 MAG: ATP:cob(I)alamin adenosyltransferase [Candidatus Roizmanbacteria bacterium CG01_land_8_20_14_3_00_33_9]PIX73831.1 MAG: ATP:cob(I)alamin adenosyltransferase [Candidatus Roizmanbacteria bacterium CG_4_10_14_3_um_filter_33_21]PJB88014.1 MAG: ATP:cob(I)alamin adenosyltransferase [Candidatus Roizmanbacteria bacterium CG_4_9_14_0_8_um_filter_34_12]
MSIYTRTGDDGTTTLFGGKRVLKSDSQVEAYGSIDELSSVLGMVISTSNKNGKVLIFGIIQKDLYLIMSFLAGAKIHLSVINDHIKLFEQEIDRITLGLPKLKRFILPRGGVVATFLHFSRTVCRRSERVVVFYAQKSTLLKNPNVLLIVKYLNRLSDFLFILARQSSNEHEVVV